MLISLFTDASFCPRTGAAGWAAWAKEDGATVRQSGAFKSAMENSAMAEAGALVNGLFVVLSLIDPPPRSKIIAASDNMEVVRLAGLAHTPVGRLTQPLQRLQNMLLARGVLMHMRHVKGHKGTITPRNAVNTWCDGAAKEHMRAARQALLDNSRSVQPVK